MSYQTDRDEFLALLTRELPDKSSGEIANLARALCRAATTLHRLAEAQCNGDWPADNGERKVVECSRCESLWMRSSMRQDRKAPKITGPGESKPRWVPLICQDCATQDRVRALLAPYNIAPIFQGDPRGCVLKLKVPSGTTNDWGREGICVPAGRGR